MRTPPRSVRTSSKLLSLALAILLVACAPRSGLRGQAARAPDPMASLRLLSLAWVKGEYDHDYDGYNELRTDMLAYAGDPALLTTLISDEQANVDAWKRLILEHTATGQEALDALAFMERLEPTRAKWRLHDDSGANDKTHVAIALVVVVIAVVVVYALSGKSPPGFGGNRSSGSSSGSSGGSKERPPSSGGRPSAQSGGGGNNSFARASSSGGGGGGGGASPTGGVDAAAKQPGKSPEELAAEQKKQDDEKRKTDLEQCLAQVHSMAPPAFSYPFPVDAFGRAKMALSMCNDKWSVCWPKVKESLPNYNAYAAEVRTISNKYDKLSLSTECPAGPINSEDVKEIAFWCSIKRENCESGLPLAETTLGNTNVMAKCVWDKSFYQSREDDCNRRFGPKP
jgi:hypothetical protein